MEACQRNAHQKRFRFWWANRDCGFALYGHWSVSDCNFTSVFLPRKSAGVDWIHFTTCTEGFTWENISVLTHSENGPLNSHCIGYVILQCCRFTFLSERLFNRYFGEFIGLLGGSWFCNMDCGTSSKSEMNWL